MRKKIESLLISACTESFNKNSIQPRDMSLLFSESRVSPDDDACQVNGTCRGCGNSRLVSILSLGDMPLANAMTHSRTTTEWDRKYPLSLAFCPDCTLLQIRETVSPRILFDEYLYYSSYSDTMLSHAARLAEGLIARCHLTGQSKVLEIGSNDGYLLQYFMRAGIPSLGVEPARNVAAVSSERGIPTLCAFFGKVTASQLAARGECYDLILALNVFAHVPDLNSFLEGVRILLRDTGTAVFEFPYVRDMIDGREFDTIYHEHLSYFLVTAAVNLFARHNLEVVDIRRMPIHGGSLRLFIKHRGNEKRTKVVHDLLEKEARDGLLDPEYYLDFGRVVEGLRRETLNLLQSLKHQGRSVIGYGAAAKGTTLLNYYGIGIDILDYIADRNPHKQGRYMPGNHIPIVAPSRIQETRPDYVLILPWNLRDEIITQLSFIREWGGRFIIPVPSLQVI